MIIAQISDPHITDAAVNATNSANNASSIQRAVTHLVCLPTAPDIVLLTGDCTNNGTVTEYNQLRELLRPLPMPVYVIPGNHDNRDAVLAAFGEQGTAGLPGFVQYVVDRGSVRLIALDTHVPGHDAGHLCAERLRWLEERLEEAPDRPTLLFMHHPPFRTGMQALDSIGLTNAEAFGTVIVRHPQIERIVAGHIHATAMQCFYGTLAVTCAATTSQLVPDFGQPQILSVVMEPPSCLLHVWRETTGFVTHTSLIGDHGPATLIHDGERWL